MYYTNIVNGKNFFAALFGAGFFEAIVALRQPLRPTDKHRSKIIRFQIETCSDH